jgi:hypothetical protein
MLSSMLYHGNKRDKWICGVAMVKNRFLKTVLALYNRKLYVAIVWPVLIVEDAQFHCRCCF